MGAGASAVGRQRTRAKRHWNDPLTTTDDVLSDVCSHLRHAERNKQVVRVGTLDDVDNAAEAFVAVSTAVGSIRAGPLSDDVTVSGQPLTMGGGEAGVHGWGRTANSTQTYTWHSKWGLPDSLDPFHARGGQASTRVAPGQWVHTFVNQPDQPAISLIDAAKQKAYDAAAQLQAGAKAKAAALEAAAGKPSTVSLFTAAQEGDEDEVSRMLDNLEKAVELGVGSWQEMEETRGGQTPLLAACKANKKYTARLLLARGANPNAVCETTGATPFLYACALANADLMAELHDRGAALWPAHGRVSSEASSIASDGKYTPYSILCENGHTRLLERLLNWNLLTLPPDPKTTAWSRMAWSAAIGEGMVLAASAGQSAVVQLCLDNGVQPNARDKKGWTALSRAVERGSEPTVRVLLEHGATVEYRLPGGGNAFHLAAKLGKEAMAGLLLREGSRRGMATMIALISMRNKAGKKPLQVAEEAGGRGAAGVVEMLEAAIAPPPPRKASDFQAILHLAEFFEAFAYPESGHVTNLPAVSMRTCAGAAARQCLDTLSPGDDVAGLIRRAGYDDNARPLGCKHGMFTLSGIASEDEGLRRVACQELASDLRRVVENDKKLQRENAEFNEGQGMNNRPASATMGGSSKRTANKDSMVLLSKMAGLDIEKNQAWQRRLAASAQTEAWKATASVPGGVDKKALALEDKSSS